MPVPAAMPLRPPDEVMRLDRLGSFHATRLSFMRTLLRRLKAERWSFDRPLWQIDANGVGRALYRAKGPRRSYTLVAFAHDLPPEQRSDRVIATAWDAMFTLFDGEPSPQDLDRLAANVPLQEAGRISETELTLSRANRSVRLWDHVTARLAAGEQPDPTLVDQVGYLMRTTAVYGSGKFGAADRERLSGRPLLGGPFRAEMLTVWLIRAFTLDMVEHLAAARNPTAARIDPALRRRFGVGNSTGLGMAPFLVTHPALLNAWISARETALARVRALDHGSEWEAFRAHLAKARQNAHAWQSEHPHQQEKLRLLCRDLDALTEAPMPTGPHPWDALWRAGEARLGLEGQEALLAAMLEPHGPLLDDLEDHMGADEAACFPIDGAMPVVELRRLLQQNYAWALRPDYQSRAATARFWYVSEEKLEPRLGERYAEPGAELEQPLAIGRDAARLATAIESADGPVAAFLLRHPEHRHIIRRVQILANRPYAEIRDNLVSDAMMPIDLLRAKLSMFGATRFDPRSDRWVRICMYQNAPLPDDLATSDDDWSMSDAAVAI
ncbi:hypothetical protein KHP62_14460 [Rhodobacteraceae bacterium NNCM2]|nr:hypothetical protein [Coraliihabitans acroporae]